MVFEGSSPSPIFLSPGCSDFKRQPKVCGAATQPDPRNHAPDPLPYIQKGNKMFFRNRAVQLQFVKPQTKHEAPEETDTSNKDPYEAVNVAAAYSAVAKDFITHTALTIGGVFAACKIIERICR